MTLRRAGYIDDEVDIERDGEQDDDNAEHGPAMVTGRAPDHSSEIHGLGAYRGGVAESPRQGAGSVAVYTAMRVGLFLGVWLLLQLLTPIRGLWAAVVAIVVSGLISLVVLNRQRTAMGSVVGGFFGRINARIDAASQAEDHWDEQAQGQGDGVGDDQVAGADQSRDESGPDRPATDDAQRSDSPGKGD